MKIFRSVFAVLLLSYLAGCGTANNYLAEKTKSVEYLRIFDIKTNASRQVVAKAASDGMGRNVNNAQESLPILKSADVPEKPGRISFANPFEGAKPGFLAMMGGAAALSFQVATCPGAVWTAKAERLITDSNQLNLTVCLFQYKEGYHLDLFAVFMKQEGGIKQMGRDLAYAISGTPEEWTEKTFLDIVRSIRATTGAEITLLEAQPEISGTPWLDSGEKVTQLK